MRNNGSLGKRTAIYSICQFLGVHTPTLLLPAARVTPCTWVSKTSHVGWCFRDTDTARVRDLKGRDNSKMR